MKFNSHNKQQYNQPDQENIHTSRTPSKGSTLTPNDKAQDNYAKKNQTEIKKTKIEKVYQESHHSKIDDHFIQQAPFVSVMNLLLTQFDGRIRVIEDNQNKIANSLSRFLDKMNSLLFKENVGKKGPSELDGISISKGVQPNFVDEIMQQINQVLVQKSLIDQNLMNTQEQLHHYEYDMRKMQTNPVKDTRNNTLQYKETSEIQATSIASQLSQAPASSIFTQQQNKTNLNRSYSSTNQEQDSEISQKQESYHSRKETPPLDQLQVKYQQSNSKPSSNMTKSVNGPASKKITSPSSNLSSSNSQTSFQQINQTSKNQPTNQATKQGQMKQIETNPQHIDFYPKETTRQNQTTRSKQPPDVQERTNDKSRTRLQQTSNKDNKERPKSSTRPQTNQQTKKDKLDQNKYETKQGQEKKSHLQTQKSQPVFHHKNKTSQNQKQSEPLEKKRSPRDEYTSQSKLKQNQSPKYNFQAEKSKLNLDIQELQKPNKQQIQNNILVEDQAQDKQVTASLKDLTGDILDCITEFTGEEFPQFIFANKVVLNNFLTYQNENLQLQQEMISEQIEELKAINPSVSAHSKSQFLLPEELLEKQEILEERPSWEKLLRDIATNKLSIKEVTVLRIYFTFLNQKNTSPQESDNQTFLRNIQQIVKKNLQSLDKVAKVEHMFKFSEEIKCRAMELMMKVDLNELVQAKFCPLVEAMLFIVVEAIQHLDNLSVEKKDDDQTEINTLEFVRDSFLDKLNKVNAVLDIINLQQ